MAGISGFANTLNLVDDTGGTVTSIAAGTGITATPDPIVGAGTIALTIPVVVSSGGTGRITLTSHGVLIGAGTSAITQLAAAAAGTLLSGVAASDPAFTSTPVLGIAGTTLGTLGFSGNTSGVVSVLPQAAAGTYNFNLPTTAGVSGQFLTSAGGVGAPMTWTSVSVPGSDTQVIFNDAGSFGADAGMTYNKTTDSLTLVGTLTFGTGGLISSFAAATARLGGADSAAPTAQNLSTPSVIAGTSNTAGANLTIKGSIGTGTGAGGSIVFQVAPAGSTGTAQNTLAAGLTISAPAGTAGLFLGLDPSGAAPFLSALLNGTTGIATTTVGMSVYRSNSLLMKIDGSATAIVNLTNASVLGSAAGTGAGDVFFYRRGAANWNFGYTDVASGAIAQTISFQGNTGATTTGPLATIVGAGGGSGAGSIGGELRLSGGLTAAAGTGGAVTIYTAAAGAGATPVLAATFDSAGLATFAAAIKTATPTTGTSGNWKLGIRVAAVTVLDTSQYIQLDVGGTLYKLAIAA